MADIITQEQLIQLREAKDKAMEDTTPFPVMKDGNLAVVGDANKTEVNKHDFTLTFIIPDENGVYQRKDVEYKDIFLKPRQAVTVQRLITALMPLFYKVQEDGGITELDDDEMLEVLRMYEGNVIDQVYRLVAVVLGVHSELVDYMDPVSVLAAFHKIMVLFPDMIKASDSFFELFSGKKIAEPSKNG